MKRYISAMGWFALGGLALAGEAGACSVCFGDPNSKTTQGLFAAMYLLLGVILFVLAGIAMTAWTWAKRARMLEKQI